MGQPDYRQALAQRFTDRARKVYQLANQEALRLNHPYVGPEHMLLGLMLLGDGVAAKALTNLGHDPRLIREEIEKTLQPGTQGLAWSNLPRTPETAKIIESSMAEARNLNHNYVGSEHILLGLLREMSGATAKVLMSHGPTLDQARDEIRRILGQPASEALDKRPAGTQSRSWIVPALVAALAVAVAVIVLLLVALSRR